MSDDRAGGSSRRAGVKPPAATFSRDFQPKGSAPKPFRFDELGARLVAAGFADGDTNQAEYLLRHISYQHASSYFDLFRRDGEVEEDASAYNLNRVMVFDRKMKSLLLEYIGVFELQFRAQYSYHMSCEKGAFAHRNPRNFKDMKKFDDFLDRYESEFNKQLRQKNAAIAKAFNKYGDAPTWLAVEIMSFGTLSMLYNNTKSKAVRANVAKSFHATTDEFASWTRAVSAVRNQCAHFGRLCGRRLVSCPKRIEGCQEDNTSPFYIFILLMHLLMADEIFEDDQSLAYNMQLFGFTSALFTEFEDVLSMVGIPQNWREAFSNPKVTGLDVGMAVKVANRFRAITGTFITPVPPSARRHETK